MSSRATNQQEQRTARQRCNKQKYRQRVAMRGTTGTATRYMAGEKKEVSARAGVPPQLGGRWRTRHVTAGGMRSSMKKKRLNAAPNRTQYVVVKVNLWQK